jgi:hypothetical protein
MVTRRLCRYSFEFCGGSGRNYTNTTTYIYFIGEIAREKKPVECYPSGSERRWCSDHLPDVFCEIALFCLQSPTLCAVFYEFTTCYISNTHLCTPSDSVPESAREICSSRRRLRCGLCINYSVFKSLNNHALAHTHTRAHDCI